MVLQEIQGKHSIHTSGTFVLPTLKAGVRDRHVIASLDGYAEAIPSASILPMKPSRYPPIERSVGSTDFVLDVTHIEQTPFAVLLYIRRRSDAEPPISQKRASWSLHRRDSFELGDEFVLCVVLYSDSITFAKWPDLEHEITSRANELQGILVWPIYEST
jgi:hypothetical protein